MHIKGYVKTRSLGNTEPNDFLEMDIFIEDALWEKYINKKNSTEGRIWDVVWMMKMFCSGPDIQQDKARLIVYLGGKKVTLRAYLHSKVMALCVGIAHSVEAKS
jgi:hypothetical protein